MIQRLDRDVAAEVHAVEIYSALLKAPEDWRTPRRSGGSWVSGQRASVLECGSPLPLFPGVTELCHPKNLFRVLRVFRGSKRLRRDVAAELCAFKLDALYGSIGGGGRGA